MIRTVLLAIALTAITALTGCLTVPEDTATKMRQSVAQICATSAQLEASYIVLRDGDVLSDSVIEKGDKAFAAMHVFCDSSQDWDPSNAALHAAVLYVQIVNVMKDVNGG